ncbi:MAG: hypothetical protein JO180_01440 [Gemmatirosa sp.]|nr:hypothetical protein [Gemmatirosa sp.]
MPPLFLYDDAAARAFEPFALTRPTGELRAGAELLRRRWERALGIQATGFVSAPHLDAFEELDAPSAATTTLPAGAIVANARAVVSLAERAPDAATWTLGGRVAAVRLESDLALDELRDGRLDLASLASLAPSEGASEVRGRWLDEVWDLVAQLAPQLVDDIAALGATIDATEHGAVVLGRHAVYVERGATIEPYVVIDASAGPVLVRAGATVQSFTRLVGPSYVGEGSTIVGEIRGCSIGDVCKVHGEISASIVLGLSNKGHDGFVGHSYLARWVNLGAGTTTSNLKNTYGTVALWTPDGVRDTGQQFLGTLFGDHAKTGIGLRLTTGTVVGAGANVYDRMPPKVVPPFAWGGDAPYGTYGAEKFVAVAERAMQRRHVVLGARGRAQLMAAHARAGEARAAGRYAVARAGD